MRATWKLPKANPVKIQVKTLSHSQLVELLKNKGGAFPVGLRATTDAKLSKFAKGEGRNDVSANPFANVSKDVRAVGFVGASYEKAVQREGVVRQGMMDADAFKGAPRSWGVWVTGCESKVACHKGRFYLRTQTTPGMRKRQPAKVLCYKDASGRVLSKDDVAPYLPAKSVSAKQASVGMDAPNQVDVREYAFDSITVLRIAGRTYRLVPDAS